MSAHLLIRDGVPNWWDSSDIWVVPGNDPNGIVGSPIAGQPAYLWAHVANTGDSAANGTRVDFYWANPAGQILQGTATLVGSAFVDIPSGGEQDVLCLVAWIPSIVNGGHECVLAVAHNPADQNPLPDPLPAGFDFNPPAHDQIAQRNLSVVVASRHAAMLRLTVTALSRVDKTVLITAEVGGQLNQTLLEQFRLKGMRPAEKQVVDVGLHREPICRGEDEPIGEREIELRVPRGTSSAVYASIRATQLERNEYQLVQIIERSERRVLGGCSYIVVHPGQEGGSK